MFSSCPRAKLFQIKTNIVATSILSNGFYLLRQPIQSSKKYFTFCLHSPAAHLFTKWIETIPLTTEISSSQIKKKMNLFIYCQLHTDFVYKALLIFKRNEKRKSISSRWMASFVRSKASYIYYIKAVPLGDSLIAKALSTLSNNQIQTKTMKIVYPIILYAMFIRKT